MWWIILTLLSAITITSVNLIDKHIVTTEVKDPFLTMVISGSTTFSLFIIFSLFFPRTSLSQAEMLAGLIAGVIYSTGLWFYYFTLSKEEVSRAAPAFTTMPLFVLPFGYLFFGEIFTTLKYAGIVLIVGGAVILSVKESVKELKFDKLMLVALFTGFLFGIRSVFIKSATLDASIWSVLPWIGLGGVATSAVVFAFHHPHIRKKSQEGVHHLIGKGFLAALGSGFLFAAISIGPVSLVTALFSIQPLFVFVSAVALSLYHPKFLKEEISEGIIIQKTVATLAVVLGAVFIAL